MASATSSCSARATIRCGSGSIRRRCRRAALPQATWCGAARSNVSGRRGRHQSAAGDSPGGFEVAVQTLGRLSTPESSATSSSRPTPDGRVTRMHDIARVEFGAQDYKRNAYLDDKVATAIGVFQRPGSNALATAQRRARRRWTSSRELPGRPRLPGRLQHHRVHPAIGRRGGQDLVRSGSAGHHCDHRVPADLARRAHSD